MASEEQTSLAHAPQTNGDVSGSGSESDESWEKFASGEEELLYVSRHGKEVRLLRLLMNNEEADEGSKLDLDCKGNQKFNRGWTPLHLAAYFGETSAVRLLLDFGASVNVRNTCMESPLHLAAYTGREEVVALLLQHGALTDVVNSQNQRPWDIARTQHIKDMIDAADNTACLRNVAEFLEAAASGDIQRLTTVFQGGKVSSINVQDRFGNSALHLAAMGGHSAAVVFLLQNGVDTLLRNNSGQTALDLAQSVKMKQVLGVEPVKSLQKQPQRYEGLLLKKSRFVGFKLMWVVLDHGVLSYFQNRGDASTGSRRKGMKYLDEAIVINTKENPIEIRIQYSDGSKHTLHLESLNGTKLALQKWLNALQEHIAFSSFYIHKGQGVPDDTADDLVSLGTMQDSLKNAQAHRGSLEDQVQTLRESITSISEHLSQGKAAGSSANGRGSGGGGAQVTAADLQVLEAQAADILRSSQDMCSALTHCMTLLVQQEELRQIQLREEQERCRVLQDSLHALATEHHELERSISRRPSFVSMDEEFFDCDDEEVFGSPTSDQFTDACSRDLVMEGADNSRASSRASCSNCGRTSLPVPMFSRSDFSFWSILKQCIGKELSKITMPVVFNEPLSFIQRLAEYMEYAPLLDKAVKCDDPVERLEYISAFAISALSSNWERIGKPFNPLLGETYEIDRPDLGFRFVGEQVSHHPPITAFHAEGNGYAFHGSIQPKLKFWGKTVEIFPKGVMTLELFKQKETYTWQNVNFNIHNIIVGQLWVEHCGTMEITNNKTSYKSVLNFKQCGWFSKELHHVEGFVYNGKKKERAMYGSWVLGMYSCPADAYESFLSNPDNKGRISTKDKSEHKTALLTYNYEIPDQKTLWRVNPRPPHSADYYHFSIFAMGLNEILPGMKSSLPRTDSRLRPDIRSMEDGKIDYSADEKNRLEEKQRDARKDRKKKNKEWTPVWFTASKNATSGKEEWSVSNNYWQRNWAACPDIF